MGRSGSPWGFGYLAGFRYINFSDRFLFSSNANSTNLTTDPAALNYLGQFNNNLFGFQLGSGLSYCVSNSLTAYAIGKVGVYDNSVTSLQRVYGAAGNAVINNGPFNGQQFVVQSAARDTFAMSGQIDLGGRWAITNNWSANFGYRVLALAGVATADDNFQQSQFHDVSGIAFLNRSGSLLIHGAYLGTTYCW
jgi:opacity protein-like surface antigen